MKPIRQISTNWITNFAYAMGLLATDGSLSKDGYHFDFTSKDKELVKTFSNCLGLKVKIGKKYCGSGKRNESFRVQFGDIEFYKWCLNFGLMPNKSKTLEALKVPDKYFFDFLRGCFDGDGSMYAYWDPRWHSSYMFYLQFASASPDFLLWVQSSIKCLIGIEGKMNKGGRGTYQLRFAKKDTKIIFNKMFYSNNIPFLKRKFTKAQKIFSIDNNHK
jgi:hypothetical protein